MRTTSLRSLAAAALAAAVVLLPAAARAEDGPGGGGMPAPPAKVEHPFALSMVGSWDLSFTMGDVVRKGVAVWRSACDGVALVEELRLGEGDDAFYGFGVMTAAADGKAVTTTWFDTEGGIDAQVYRGSFSDDGWTSSAEMPGRGTWTMSMAKKGETRVLSMKAGDQPLFQITYTKAEKPVEGVGTDEKRLLKHPLAEAMLGAWDVAGSFEMGGSAMPYDGTVAWRRALGGTCLVAETTMNFGPMGTDRGVAIARFDVEKKTMKFWGWPSTRPPTRMEGTVTDTAFDGQTLDAGPFGAMKMKIEKTDEGFATTFSAGPIKGTEKLTRRK